jgi:hypothetical protein
MSLRSLLVGGTIVVSFETAPIREQFFDEEEIEALMLALLEEDSTPAE